MSHLHQVVGCFPTLGACVAPSGTMKARSQEGGFLVRSRCNVLSHGSGVHGVNGSLNHELFSSFIGELADPSAGEAARSGHSGSWRPLCGNIEVHSSLNQGFTLALVLVTSFVVSDT